MGNQSSSTSSAKKPLDLINPAKKSSAPVPPASYNPTKDPSKSGISSYREDAFSSKGKSDVAQILTSTPPPSSSTPTTPVTTTPVATTPVATTPVATTPVTTPPVATTRVATTPVATTPVATTSVATTPVATTPDAPVYVTPPSTASNPAAAAPVSVGAPAQKGDLKMYEPTSDLTPNKSEDGSSNSSNLLVPLLIVGGAAGIYVMTSKKRLF